MFGKLINTWNNYGFEIILGLCVAFIIIIGLYYKFSGKKGTYSKSVYIPTTLSRKKYEGYAPSKKQRDSKGEIECRRVLEHLFRRPFNKSRPDFLRNPVTGGNFNLELDCYNRDLRLAVEYNGAQHYKYIPYFETEFIENKPEAPVKALVQLAYVLPRNSLHLLPHNIYEKLIIEHSNWYQLNYDILWTYCKYFWESHIILPRIDINVLNDIIK